MPLRKLWNAITGRSGTPTGDVKPESESAENVPTASTSGKLESREKPVSLKISDSRKKTARKPKKAIVSPPEPTAQPVLAERTKPPRAKVSGRDPLIKAISGAEFESPATILEIGVGDGSRAIKVCTVLEESLAVVRYVAIDQFEMGGGETKLMDFHRSLRAVGIRPQVFPEPLESGLTRVAHTIGACDLVLISDQVSDADLDAIEPQLARIAHPDTRVLVNREKGWIIHTLRRADLRRAA